MASKKEPIPWSREHGDIYENFILDYVDFVNGGGVPAKANQDMQYVMELQRKRLEKFGIKAHIQAESTDTGEFARLSKSWRDDLYEGRQRIMPCLVRRTFHQGEKKLHSKEESLILYETVLDAESAAKAHDHSFTCPNCGNVSTVGQLHEGCPFCGTHFKFAELFPRVSNFFFLRNESLAGKKLLPQILKFYPLALLLLAISILAQGSFELSAATVISTLVGSFILAYPLWVLFFLMSMLYRSGKSAWLMLTSMGSKKQFQRQMDQLSPNFSFDYFAEEAILLLEMLVYSDHPQEMPIYEGADIPQSLGNIVQLDYCGAVALRKFRMEGSTCSVDVEVYADVLRYTGGDLHQERDVFSLTLFRSMDQPWDIGYSPLKVRCHSCGASFDAVHQKHCPYCDTPYENDHRDWTVAGARVQKNNPITTLLGIVVVVAVIIGALMALMIFANLLPVVLLAVCLYLYGKAAPARKKS